MKKVRTIDVVVKFFHPVAAGIETNVLQTYKVLTENGWRVRIHTSKDTHIEKNILSDFEMIQGIEVYRYPYKWFSYVPKIDYMKTDVVALHNFNIIPHLFIMLYSLFLKITKQKRFSLILTPHGGFTPDWNIFSQTEIRIKKLYHYTLGTALINLIVDKVRAVSNWERTEIISHRVKDEKVVVISNGVEDEAFMDLEKLVSLKMKKMVKGFGRYILQIGRIYKIKNYETTIQSLKDVPSDITYVIAGPIADEMYFEKLKTLIKSLGLTKRVIFVGVHRGVDKFYLIKHAQMMVHMAHWESFCNVVHEGMSQGLVCLVANNTALPFLVKDQVNGFTIDTMDSKTLAEKITYVLNPLHAKEMIAMRKTNRAFGREESWRSVAHKMDALYKETLKQYEK